ncbi:MAG: diaminopimelate epimerase [Planctomycetota bacterium]|nr:MAG: diaminopimelate epimerase [Planctomycetota bacterium]
MSAGRGEAVLLSAAGNRFVLIDARAGGAPRDAAALARALCAAESTPAQRRDGLLLLLPPEGVGDARLVIHNRDGTRPEACGNGLRCVGFHLGTRDGAAGERRIETDAGVRAVTIDRDDGERLVVRAELGPARLVERDEWLESPGGQDRAGRVRVTLVDVGNPHCVLFVGDVLAAPVAELGPQLERHPRFPQGTNVEFVAYDDEAHTLDMRVWERGVGETQACGTGAAAAARAATERYELAWPVRVRVPGGVLEVSGDAECVWLAGPVEREGEIAWCE